MLPHFSACSARRARRPTLRRDPRPWRCCLAGRSCTPPSRSPCSVPLGRGRTPSRPEQSSGHIGDTGMPRLRWHWWRGWSRSLRRRCCTFSPSGSTTWLLTPQKQEKWILVLACSAFPNTNVQKNSAPCDVTKGTDNTPTSLKVSDNQCCSEDNYW